jgi:hypothetical protein
VVLAASVPLTAEPGGGMKLGSSPDRGGRAAKTDSVDGQYGARAYANFDLGQ